MSSGETLNTTSFTEIDPARISLGSFTSLDCAVKVNDSQPTDRHAVAVFQQADDPFFDLFDCSEHSGAAESMIAGHIRSQSF